MREIKFRAWDKKEKRMYDQQDKYTCGLVILLDGLTEYGGCLDYSSEPEFDSFQWYNKEIVEKRYVLMQFTGLKDKNGTEIYEGDITERSTGYRQEIKLIQIRQCYSTPPTNRTFWAYDIIEGEDKVIGNIHQNPELMEQEK